MTLWVDYTNHRGEREWREISDVRPPEMTMYPPKAETKDQKHKLCTSVRVADRAARRTLALTSIHGFAEQDTKPEMTAEAAYRKSMMLQVEQSQARGEEIARLAEEVTRLHSENNALKAQNEKLADALNAETSEFDTRKALVSLAQGGGPVALEAIKLLQDLANAAPRPQPSPERMAIDGVGKDILDTLTHGFGLKPTTDNPLAQSHFSQIKDMLVTIVERLDAFRVKEPVVMTTTAAGLMGGPIELRTQITLAGLRFANVERQRQWAGDVEVSYLFRATELAGEAGELCNEVKKLYREEKGWKGSRTTHDKLAHEIGDVMICADLLAMALGIDTTDAVRKAFNAKSQEHGFHVYL